MAVAVATGFADDDLGAEDRALLENWKKGRIAYDDLLRLSRN